MEPLRHPLTKGFHIETWWSGSIWWLHLVMNQSEIFSCPSLCKSAGKTTCLLLWAPRLGSIWRILCVTSRILHCGLGGCEGLASRSDRLAPEENYTVPIEEWNVLTTEPVWALLRRQNLLPFSGTKLRPVGRRVHGQPLYHITHSHSRKIVYVYNSLYQIPVSWEAWRKQVFVWGLSLKKWNLFF